jgi:hypothetical protein
MAVGFSNTNKPLNPRGQDASPKGYNRAKLYSGKALDFDGVNDVVNVTTNDLDFGANDFSVSAIVHWSGSHTDGKLAYAERGSSGSQLAAWQIRTDGTGNMLFQANTVADGWQAVYFSGVEAIISDGLTHLTFVRVGTGATLYINGQFYSTGTGSIQATLDTPNGAFVIGNRIGSSNYWNGLVTQFKVYSTALTAAQVADLYNNPEKVVPTGVDNTALKLWLPMMEGAGTTAYDGSGNGNHGTISGATYVNGIGAPSPQSAVMDWNKGTNIVPYSEYFSTYIQYGSPTITENNIISPQGLLNGTKVQRGSIEVPLRVGNLTTLGTEYTATLWAKAGTATKIRLDIGDETAPTYDLTSEWQRIEVTATPDTYTHIDIEMPSSSSGDYFYIYGLQIQLGDTAGPYVPTFGTAQTSEVLLPQGLTTGRDITGVNLFENVRKQGALNLDGNSWAEVHDNASLDVTTAVTLEAWVKWDIDGVQNKGILGKWGSSSGYLLYKSLSTRLNFFINGNSSLYISLTNGWNHIVGTYDGANRKIYINGALEETDADTSTITESALNVEIGTYGGFGSSAYDQPIAQPRIYNRALTAAEVLQNYNSGKNTYK